MVSFVALFLILNGAILWVVSNGAGASKGWDDA